MSTNRITAVTVWTVLISAILASGLGLSLALASVTDWLIK